MTERRLERSAVHRGDLILVNAQLPFAGPEEQDRVCLDANVMLARRAAEPLRRLVRALGGWSVLAPVSGWRSQREQQEIYESSLCQNGRAFTEQFVALPGHSEHQTGLAIDLGQAGPDLDFICPDFPYCGICQEFRRRAVDYGFVERYRAGKESVTGIAHEPWHFRYVGRPHAAIMMQRVLVLEEYHSFLKNFPLGGTPLCWKEGKGVWEIVFVPLQGAQTCIPWGENGSWAVSGNNEDGFILTSWKEQ